MTEQKSPLPTSSRRAERAASHPLAQIGWTPDRDAELAGHPGGELARVSLVHGDVVSLETAEGPRAGTIPGRLRHRAASPLDLPTVGDWIALDAATGSVLAVLHRRSTLIRAGGGATTWPQALAANVDLVLVMSSLNRDLTVPRLQRMLTIAAAAPAEAVVVLTKSDLSDDPAAEVGKVRGELAGVAPVLALSLRDGTGLEALEAFLRPGVTAVLLGSSGVGKTTLRNRLSFADAEPTAPVRASDDRGRHTTTRRELVRLRTGAVMVDTPGLRHIEAWETPDAGGAFADIEALVGACRFADCSHDGEPGCAVAEAIAEGRLDAARVAAWARQEREQAWLERRKDEYALREQRAAAKRMERELRRTYRERER